MMKSVNLSPIFLSMKRPSSPSLQFLAAAATSTEASTVMSYRPPYRAVQYQARRGVSDQSASGQFVTGDSHFQSVSDANQGFRSNFNNPTPYRSQTRPPTVHNTPPPHVYPPTYPYPRPPYFNPRPDRNQGFRPRPQQFRPRPSKPLDYREWEFSKLRPPPQCERFKVLSYNILADYLASNHRSKLYFHIPPKMLAWEWRKRSIIFEIGLWSADILCFQEVDKFQDLEGELKLQGYSGIWKMRTGTSEDGCAIFWRVSRFKLMHEECIEFNKLGLRNNIAQICVFESLNQTDTKDTSAPKSSLEEVKMKALRSNLEVPLPDVSGALQSISYMDLSGSNKVVICNIHVLYNPRRGEIKLGQIRVLLDRAHAVSKLWDDAPIVLSGDFNCTPKSPLYNFISEQKLNLSDLPRDELSGQASAEIRPPKKFSPDIRAQQADCGGGASVVVDHRELSQSGSPLVVHQQSGPERNLVNLPSINSIPQPQCVSAGSNVYVSNPHSGQCGNESGKSSPEMTKQTHQEDDGFQDETPDGGLSESLSSSQNKVGVLVDQMKERHTENIYSNLLETKLTKETSQDAVSSQDAVDGFNNVFHSMVSISGLRISPQIGGKVSGAPRKDGDEFTSVYSCNDGLTEAEHEKQMHASINSQSDPSIEQSEPKVHTENKITSCEKIEVSFLSSNNTTDTISDPTPSGTSSELFHESSFPSTVGVSTMGSSESFSSLLPAKDKDNPSNFSKVNVSCELTSTDYVIDGKMENLLLKELPENDDGDEVFGEDSTKFLSELNSGNEPFSSDFSHAVSSDFVESDKSFKETEPHVALNFRSWTPMEIETATGNADCTLVEHPLKLRSTYAEVEDCSGTRDSNGEPQVTSYNRCFLGTVDYIWRSEGLQTVRVLAPIPKHAMQWTPGFPTKKWGSDHIALVSELAFVKGGSTQNT